MHSALCVAPFKEKTSQLLIVAVAEYTAKQACSCLASPRNVEPSEHAYRPGGFFKMMFSPISKWHVVNLLRCLQKITSPCLNIVSKFLAMT